MSVEVINEMGGTITYGECSFHTVAPTLSTPSVPKIFQSHTVSMIVPLIANPSISSRDSSPQVPTGVWGEVWSVEGSELSAPGTAPRKSHHRRLRLRTPQQQPWRASLRCPLTLRCCRMWRWREWWKMKRQGLQWRLALLSHPCGLPWSGRAKLGTWPAR